MGHIAKILGKFRMDGPNGWNPDKGQYNLPFTVELKENIHIHWQDLRIEMMPEDFDDFVEALNKAHERWEEDGRPQELEEMKRYGWWPGEEGYDWGQDRYEKYNKEGELCHNFRTFPRTEHEDLSFDNLFQIELQKNSQYHIHYKNFRFEMGKERFNHIAHLMYNASRKEKNYGKIYNLLGKIRFIRRNPRRTGKKLAALILGKLRIKEEVKELINHER